FFFSSRRRHTRLQGDWSSDVCSSDLIEYLSTKVGFVLLVLGGMHFFNLLVLSRWRRRALRGPVAVTALPVESRRTRTDSGYPGQIGRASCRERVEIAGSAVALHRMIH